MDVNDSAIVRITEPSTARAVDKLEPEKWRPRRMKRVA